MANENDKFTVRLGQICDDDSRQLYGIKGSKCSIGRGSYCDVRVDSHRVSRTHCIMNRTDEGWKITNKSQNGTYVSGKRLMPGESHILQCGDKIFLGPPAEKPEAFCIFLDEEHLKDAIPKQVLALKRPAEIEVASPRKKLHFSKEPSNKISNTDDFSLVTNCHNDDIPSPAMPPNLTSRPRSTSKESVCKHMRSWLMSPYPPAEESEDDEIIEIIDSSIENVEVENSLDLENNGHDISTQVMKRSPHEDLQTLITETELLKTKLDALSEQFNLLEESNSDLLKNYEEVCKQNSKHLEEQNQLREDLKSCELKAKNAVKNELLKKFEEDLICNICTELLIKPTVLDCTHTFCLYCIKEWKKTKNNCPICRHKIMTMTSILTLDNFIEKTLLTLTPQQREKRKKLVKEHENALKASTTSRLPTSRLSDHLVFAEDDRLLSDFRNAASSLPMNLPLPLRFPFPAYINNVISIRRMPQTVSADNNGESISGNHS